MFFGKFFTAIYWIVPILLAVSKLVCLLVAIAYYTLAERKVMAAFQRRVGPNVVGPLGLLQPLADGLKLAGKEFVIPSHADSSIFIAAAMTTLVLALTAWTVIPLNLVDYSTQMRFSIHHVLVFPASYMLPSVA